MLDIFLNKIINLTKNNYHILIIFFVNIITFKNHYFGELAFPWDFLGGYHSHAFSWIREFKNFEFNSWIPWSDIGFPSSMAIQSGAWYIPLAIYGLFIENYSIQAAVIFQVLHVFIGSVGVYYLIKSLNFESKISLLCALVYHFTTGFYSNQQHVDIIRSYALLPWIIYYINPVILNNNILNKIILTTIISQFLIVGYPGIIVSGFYTASCFFFYFLINTKEKKYYLTSILYLSFIGFLLSLVKWLPFFSNYELITFENSNHLTKTDPNFLLTIFYSYSKDYFNGEITMRGIYISTITLFIIYFNNFKKNINILGLVLITLFLFRVIVLPNFPLLMSILPGSKLSRFPISDWRFTFYIGILIIFASSLETIIKIKIINFKNLFFLLLSLILLYFISVNLNISSKDAANYLLKSFIFIFIFIFILMLNNKYKHKLLFVYLIITISADGIYYNNANSIPWKLSWNKETELQIYNFNFENTKINNDPIIRPERIYFGEGVTDILQMQSSLYYNKCIITKQFCLFGYNNLKLSKPHIHIKQVIKNNSAPTLFNFLVDKQHLVYINKNKNIKDYPIGTDFLISDNKNIISKPILYSNNKLTYYIKTPIDADFLENEIWWKGWSYRYCDLNQNCSKWLSTKKNKDYLRIFTIPSGEWIVTVEFKQPWKSYTLLVACVAFMLMLIFVIYEKKWIEKK